MRKHGSFSFVYIFLSVLNHAITGFHDCTLRYATYIYMCSLSAQVTDHIGTAGTVIGIHAEANGFR